MHRGQDDSSVAWPLRVQRSAAIVVDMLVRLVEIPLGMRRLPQESD